MATKSETLEFQAETRQLLDIVIHSLYSNKEIFLRELISNASDALDRLRFAALTDSEVMSGDEELQIRIDPDPEARTLTISDNGIGMSRDEVIANIGTIAKSGTRELVDKLKAGESSETVARLIGQFGVGFYSAFMVADKVVLITRRAGDESATRWESTGDGEFTVGDDHRFERGTTITLHLKPVDVEHGIEDFTDSWVVSRIVKRYSDFVSYPIIAKVTREEPRRDTAGEPIEGETESVVEDQTLNSRTPIWTRSKDDVKEEELAEFYKHISHDWSDPLDSVSLRAEGRIEYQALLFLPSKSWPDLFYRDAKWGLQLYVRRVLIMDHCEDLLPPYLRFVRGVVDSADLPLSISRETVQQDRHIQQMRKWLARKLLDHLAGLAADSPAKYVEFWGAFGRILKEGVSTDAENRDRIVPLLRFASSRGEEELTTLGAYVERMKDDQEEIYYLSGESRAVVENSPHLEAFRERDYEVLYLTDPVDEFVMHALPEFEGKRLKSVGKGEVELGSAEEQEKAEQARKEKEEDLADLMKRIAEILDDSVADVRLSRRLTASPVCLVGNEHDLSPHLERLMRESEMAPGPSKRILELNPDHEVITKLADLFREDAQGSAIEEYAHLLLGHALLAEGSELPDPVRYNRLVGQLMLRNLASGSGE